MSQYDEVATPPPVSIAVIETDTFCERCGFNLHTQRVWRDGRLGILVTRCPECGAHQAAGKSTAVSSKWLQRLALLGLMTWIAIVLAYVISAFFIHFGITIATYESFTRPVFETIDGRPVEQDYDSRTGAITWKLANTDEHVPSTTVISRRHLVPELGGPSRQNDRWSRIELAPVIILGTLFGVGVFAMGVVEATGSWFWRRGWSIAWIALPFVAGLLVFAGEYTSRQNRAFYMGEIQSSSGFDAAFGMIGAATIAQMMLIGLGLLVGRGVARFFVSVIVPPKSRQLFAFLWHADGLTLRGPDPTLPG